MEFLRISIGYHFASQINRYEIQIMQMYIIESRFLLKIDFLSYILQEHNRNANTLKIVFGMSSAIYGEWKYR